MDIIKSGLWSSACLGSDLMVFGINRFASFHVSPTRARSMALHTNRQFCYTCTATRKLLSLALPCRNENFAGKRATVNTTLGTWLAVGDGVGARRAEGAVGVSKKRATMRHGMSAFFIRQGQDAGGECPIVIGYTSIPFYWPV